MIDKQDFEKWLVSCYTINGIPQTLNTLQAKSIIIRNEVYADYLQTKT